ncbi:hypothetical protein [Variovorax rhizosphaerae]|uniref:Uncharacterized protein n=1 Tax=Variovorax rhizosphaerae TaxID=1836200 RepID=A0ABU8WJK3_9BURK
MTWGGILVAQQTNHRIGEPGIALEVPVSTQCREIWLLNFLQGMSQSSESADFAPDDRMRSILEAAAPQANAQMRVMSFADGRPDRVVSPDRQWQWAAFASRTATSTPPNVWMWMRERNGSTRPSVRPSWVTGKQPYLQL